MTKKVFCCILFIFCFVQTVNAKFVDTRPQFFSIEQEKFLAKYPEFFAYFTELYVKKKTPEQIGKEHQLSVEQNIEFLRGLAAIHVLKISDEKKMNDKQLPNSISFLVSGTQHFIEKGPLSKTFDELTLSEFFNKISKEVKDGKLTFYNSGFWITDKQHDAYMQEIDAIEKKYIQLSLENRRNRNAQAHRVSACLIVIPNWEPAFYTEINKKH